MMEIRKIIAADAENYRAFRLSALANYPAAFASTFEEERQKPAAAYISRFGTPESPDDFIMGAFDAHGTLLGTAGFTRRARRSECHEGALFAMTVAEQFQAQGIGRRLVDALVAEARRQDGLLQIELHVSDGNTPAIRLYESCGFKVFGKKPRATMIGGKAVAKIMMLLELDRAATRP